jgi:hypothetical protein
MSGIWGDGVAAAVRGRAAAPVPAAFEQAALSHNPGRGLLAYLAGTRRHKIKFIAAPTPSQHRHTRYGVLGPVHTP